MTKPSSVQRLRQEPRVKGRTRVLAPGVKAGVGGRTCWLYAPSSEPARSDQISRPCCASVGMDLRKWIEENE